MLRHFNTSRLRAWYDTGHGQIRENLGIIRQSAWLDKLDALIGGMHVHDVAPPANDHLMPRKGAVDFSLFKKCAASDIPLVLEPYPGTPAADVREGAQELVRVWGLSSE